MKIEKWKHQELRDIGTVVTGKTPPTKNPAFWNGDIPFITPGDLGEHKYVTTTERGITMEGAKRVNVLPDNAVMVVCIGSTIGKTGMTIKQSVTNQQINALICCENIDPYFVYYALTRKEYAFRNYAGVAAVPIIKKTLFEKTKIFIPESYGEQRNISKILSTVDLAIEKTGTIIQKTERIKQGLVNKYFLKNRELKYVPLIDVFDVKSGSTPSTKNNKYWENGRINWLTPADLGKLEGDIYIEKSERKISDEALNGANLNLMPIDSIVMSTRAPVGYVALLRMESTFNQGCKGLLPREEEEVNPLYYAYYLSSKRYVLGNRAGQSTFKELSKTMLEKFNVPQVHIDYQNEVAERLMLIGQKINLEKKRKLKLERIKQGLMNDLLTGKKRIKGD